MSFSPAFANHIVSQMASHGRVTIKKMFGECGLYSGATLFAMIADDILYFKASAALADALRSLGSEPFTYHGKSGKLVAMPYWRAPEIVLDDQDQMKLWCDKAVQAAGQKPIAKKAPSKKITKASSLAP